MVKKRAIVSYEKLTLDQKKKLENAFPDGYRDAMTQIKTPTGETLDAIFWETEEIIYLVKLLKPQMKALSVDDDDDNDDDDVPDEDIDVKDEDEDASDDDEDDPYDDVADEDEDEDDEV